jgi:site-specific recombinase XerC
VRKHALCAALLGSGLRVSEVVNLDRDQYTGKGLSRVQIKGGVIRAVVAVPRDVRHVLDAWLTARQDDSPAFLLTRTGRQLSRRDAYGIVCRVAAQAHAHLPEEEHIDISPRTAAYFLTEACGNHRGALCPRSLWTSLRPVSLARRDTGAADARGGH